MLPTCAAHFTTPCCRRERGQLLEQWDNDLVWRRMGCSTQPVLDKNIERSSMVNGWEGRVCTRGGWHERTCGGEWSWMFSSHKEVDESLSPFPSKEERGSGKLRNQSVAEQHYNPEFLTTNPGPRLRVSAGALRLPAWTFWREVISFTLCSPSIFCVKHMTWTTYVTE